MKMYVIVTFENSSLQNSSCFVTCVVSSVFHVTAVFLLFLLKLKWPKNKSVYDVGMLFIARFTAPAI